MNCFVHIGFARALRLLLTIKQRTSIMLYSDFITCMQFAMATSVHTHKIKRNKQEFAYAAQQNSSDGRFVAVVYGIPFMYLPNANQKKSTNITANRNRWHMTACIAHKRSLFCSKPVKVNSFIGSAKMWTFFFTAALVQLLRISC